MVVAEVEAEVGVVVWGECRASQLWIGRAEAALRRGSASESSHSSRLLPGNHQTAVG